MLYRRQAKFPKFFVHNCRISLRDEILNSQIPLPLIRHPSKDIFKFSSLPGPTLSPFSDVLSFILGFLSPRFYFTKARNIAAPSSVADPPPPDGIIQTQTQLQTYPKSTSSDHLPHCFSFVGHPPYHSTYNSSSTDISPPFFVTSERVINISLSRGVLVGVISQVTSIIDKWIRAF